MLMMRCNRQLSNLTRRFIDHELKLQRMRVLFTTVEALLAFLGRSMGTSLASNNTTTDSIVSGASASTPLAGLSLGFTKSK